MCTNQLTKRLVHQCAFPTLMCEPVPCLGAHGLGLLLASPVRSDVIATSHGIAPMADPSWCTGHCAPVLCVGIPVRVSYLFGATRPWHCAHGFISWLTAQGLGALMPAWGEGRLHQAPCRCGHGVHTTHVVEPMCACSSHIYVS